MVPYNMPTSAYDLLLRLLTHQSFIDEETRQIRIKPDTQSQGVSPLDMVGDLAHGAAGTRSQGSSSASMEPPNGQVYHQRNGMILPVGLALVLGFLMGALVVHKRRSKPSGYHVVPDVERE